MLRHIIVNIENSVISIFLDCDNGGVGCMACGKKRCRFCGTGQWRPCKYKTTIQITTTTTTTPSQQITVLTSSDPTETTIDPPPQKGCGSCSQSVEDNTCFTDSDPLLGLGCRACGIDKCRHCGFGPYPACTAVSNVEIGTSCNDCDRSVEDKKCGDPTTDPFGGLGCNACGKRTCRHCGFGPYLACDALSKPMKDECGSCLRSKKDSRCANPGTDPHAALAAMHVAYMLSVDSAALTTGRPVSAMNPNQQVNATVVAAPKRTVAAQTRAQIRTVAWAATPVA